MRRNLYPIDVALIHVSPPDKHGFCSLGVSVDVARGVCHPFVFLCVSLSMASLRVLIQPPSSVRLASWRK